MLSVNLFTKSTPSDAHRVRARVQIRLATARGLSSELPFSLTTFRQGDHLETD